MDLSFLETQSYSTAPASGFAGVGEQHMSEAAIDGAPDGLMMPPGDDVRAPFSCSPFRSLSLRVYLLLAQGPGGRGARGSPRPYRAGTLRSLRAS